MNLENDNIFNGTFVNRALISLYGVPTHAVPLIAISIKEV